MAHPKHKISKQRRNKRRTHDKAELPTLATCSNCGATVMYHHVCPSDKTETVGLFADEEEY